METPVYEEIQRLRWPTVGLILATIAAAVGIRQSGPQQFVDWAGFVFIIVAGAVAAWGFGRMTTRVTPTELRFGYPIWRKRLPLAQVRVGAVKPLRIWHGIGIHWLGGTWVYNAHLGQAVEVGTGSTRYLIGSKEPERLQAALLQQTGSRVRA